MDFNIQIDFTVGLGGQTVPHAAAYIISAAAVVMDGLGQRMGHFSVSHGAVSFRGDYHRLYHKLLRLAKEIQMGYNELLCEKAKRTYETDL